MLEPVIYIRGIPPPHDAAATEQRMMADLKVVSALTDDSVGALSARLLKVSGFLDPKKLAATVRSLIDNESVALAVQRTLKSVAPGDADRFVAALTQRREEDGFPLNASELDRLREVLPALVQPYPAMKRFGKAQHLAKLTGQQLESIELICDLRPIFDEDREQIEGMMPYTRLHIVATGADGLPKSFEAELTHQQVNDLRDKAQKASSKLDVLRQAVETWLPEGLPDLPLTHVSGRQASDV